MTLHEIHAEIKKALPPQSFVIVEHTLRNYSDGMIEAWASQVYRDDNSPLENIFIVNSAHSPQTLIEASMQEWERYKAKKAPSKAAEIARLKAKLSKLEGDNAA